MSIDRKQLIIEAATKSFTIFGYKATTIEQVARLANVGKGTIYTFFTNKEQLFKEIVHKFIEEMKMVADENISPDKAIHENIYNGLFAILQYRKDHQFMMKLFDEEKEMGTRTVSEMVQEIENAIIQYIKEKIEMAVEKGELTVSNTELLAFLLLKMYNTIIFDWEKNHKPLKEEEIVRLFQVFILKGLSK
ncbi:TetR/AcrR family transcriptional regulator [Bacillus sp. AGMB 02131]|uniref:TetR/AcrR family transcriptional regulator n=1 Tax=Peribacillus faecalis TaxID=2772559 RepID=A0A927D049_9BACI|nr:TetR/AcrR family transcriptional regulator [Peribacillus faecalis]MBD3110269.1 TetR/AcrR family transcriptional regulator [Peribacillus faecalis]